MPGVCFRRRERRREPARDSGDAIAGSSPGDRADPARSGVGSIRARARVTHPRASADTDVFIRGADHGCARTTLDYVRERVLRRRELLRIDIALRTEATRRV